MLLYCSPARLFGIINQESKTTNRVKQQHTCVVALQHNATAAQDGTHKQGFAQQPLPSMKLLEKQGCISAYRCIAQHAVSVVDADAAPHGIHLNLICAVRIDLQHTAPLTTFTTSPHHWLIRHSPWWQ